MTIEPDVVPERRFAASYLPWLVAAGAWAVYLLTLNRWVSLASLAPVAKAAGWSWRPELHGPLYWLVTYPVRWLPVRMIPLALNLFSAGCAGLSLALLARSVALLPHDRTHQQREKELGKSALLSIRNAWLPPVLAALVCGLQLTFWEDATAASSQFVTGGSNEMFDLLLFAYVIRCLLEFRVDQAESWLLRAASVYGAAITNNWAMIGFLPLFLAALIWLKGLSFFNLRFLSRFTLCGLGPLLFYLLLPLVESRSPNSIVPFWPALKTNLATQKYILGAIYNLFKLSGQQEAMLLCLTSLVPIFVISLRWASYFGDRSQLGVTLASFTFHVVHALFLVVCVWVALDPPFSPRNKGFGIPLLTFYYLGALCVGYFSGYFLLLFSSRAKAESSRRTRTHLRLINTAVTSAIWVLLVLAPAALVYRNLSQIRSTNGNLLKEYAASLAQGLPPRGAVLFSDDSRRLLLLQLWLTQNGRSKDYLFVDSAGEPNNKPLTYPDYHRYLKRQYGNRWPVVVPESYNQPVDEGFLIQLARRLAATNSLCYLHPSFGYYFEFFYPEAHGLVYKLLPYPANSLLPPPPTKGVIAENDAFWASAGTGVLKTLSAVVAPESPGQRRGVIDQLMKQARLAKEPNHDASVLAGFYSRALDYWGAEMQKIGRLTNAAALFARALELNPDNLVAQINLGCNQNLRTGRESSVQVSKSVDDQFGKYRSWDQIVGENGPFDEPNFCFEQGRVLNNLHHQAAQQFDRVKTLAPRNLIARIWLAQLYVVNHLPSQALQLVNEIRTHPEFITVPATNRTEMLFVEASAHLASGDLKSAERVVQSALDKHPADADLLDAATRVFMNCESYSNALMTVDQEYAATRALMNSECYSNALMTIDQELKISTNNLTALVNKGIICIRLGAYEQAIPPLNRALELDPNNPYARWDRAIANLRCDQLDAAQRDYETLQKSFPTATWVNYGLQEIAYRKKDTNAAIRYCQIYLARAGQQTNSAEPKLVSARLKELKSGSH